MINRQRQKIPNEAVSDAIIGLEDSLTYRLHQNGDGTFVSTHEILGIIAEEYDELVEAVRYKPVGGSYLTIQDELMDIATACIFAIACISEGTLDW